MENQKCLAVQHTHVGLYYVVNNGNASYPHLTKSLLEAWPLGTEKVSQKLNQAEGNKSYMKNSSDAGLKLVGGDVEEELQNHSIRPGMSYVKDFLNLK